MTLEPTEVGKRKETNMALTMIKQTSTSVSMIICTFNRRPLVTKLIDSILPQLPTTIPFEVIVVDNNSTDDTVEFIRRLAEGSPFLRYVFEARQGLSNARNAGAATARNDFLVFIDDDAVLSGAYVSHLVEVLCNHDPDMFGGPIYPDYVAPKPAWFPEKLEVRKKAEQSGFHVQLTLSGGNIGIRRALLARLGGFNPAYGMTGGKVGMLEERLVIETYRRLTPPQQQKVYYCLDSFILHRTPAARMTLRFQLRRIWVANFQYIGYCLEQGVRRTDLLGGLLWKRLSIDGVHLLFKFVKEWQRRSEEPDVPMQTFISFLYRVADWSSYVKFALFNSRSVRCRISARIPEARPLNVLFLADAELDDPSLALTIEAREIAKLRKTLSECTTSLTIRSIQGMENKQIRKLVLEENIRWYDVILTDSNKAVIALKQLRIHFPHIQIILWIVTPAVLHALDNLRGKNASFKAMLYHLKMILRCFRLDRQACRSADQVLVPNEWIARRYVDFLVSKRHTVVVSVVPFQERADLLAERNRVVIPLYCGTPPLEKKAVQLAGHLAAVLAKRGLKISVVGGAAVKVPATPNLECYPANDYWTEMQRAEVVIIPLSMLWRGAETVIVDALALGKPVIVPKGMLRRLPAALIPLCVAFAPSNPSSLLAAIDRVAASKVTPEQRKQNVESMRVSMLASWRSVLDTARIWAPRRSLGTTTQDPLATEGADLVTQVSVKRIL